MKYWINSLLIILVAIVQVSLLPYIFNPPIIPNFLMIIILALCLAEEDKVAFWWVALGGLVADLMSMFWFGMYVVQFLVVYFGIRFGVRGMLQKPNLLISFLILLLASFIANTIAVITSGYYNLLALVVLAIYEGVASVILYKLILRYKTFVSPIKLD